MLSKYLKKNCLKYIKRQYSRRVDTKVIISWISFESEAAVFFVMVLIDLTFCDRNYRATLILSPTQVVVLKSI